MARGPRPLRERAELWSEVHNQGISSRLPLSENSVNLPASPAPGDPRYFWLVADPLRPLPPSLRGLLPVPVSESKHHSAQHVGLEPRDRSLITSTGIVLIIREYRPTSAHTSHRDLSEPQSTHL